MKYMYKSVFFFITTIPKAGYFIKLKKFVWLMVLGGLGPYLEKAFLLAQKL